MIPSNANIRAQYTEPKTKTGWTLPVVAWTASGQAMVPDRATGSLVIARNQTGFVGLYDDRRNDSKTKIKGAVR
ncbi:hypothetical protein [Kocuria kalidii]|uniref:hypothetical protein n=1 Tax=Kocuria kalidii TaxID=3376283 RepID=UPI0037A7DA4F